MNDLLESLPEMTGSLECQNCGSSDWRKGKTKGHDDHEVIMCSNCPGIPQDWVFVIGYEH